MEILRKLTIKTGGFDIAAVKAALGDNKTADLLKVVGITTEARPGQTEKGEIIKIGGTFRAINLQTGEVFEASTAIFPNFIADSLAAALAQSQEVEFGILIGAKANATSVTGYEYTVRPLVEAKVSDKLGALIAAAGLDAPLSLEAPSAAEAPAKAPAKARK
jgi:hypothetical protein